MASKSKHSKNRHEESEDEASDSEDGSVDSRSPSESSVMSTESPPPAPERMNGDRIRQTARELLQASPDDARRSRTAARPSDDNMAHGYQSYHGASTTPPSSEATAATPPWDVGHNKHDAGLGVTDVASLAFSCVAGCLAEGYRAASSYYGGYENTQFPAAPDANASHNRQVAGGDAGNIATTGYNYTVSDNGGTNNNGFGVGGYQTKFSDTPVGYGKVMDRSVPPRGGPPSSGRVVEENTLPATEPKGDWATVRVPTTYQGGRVGN